MKQAKRIKKMFDEIDPYKRLDREWATRRGGIPGFRHWATFRKSGQKGSGAKMLPRNQTN